LVLKYNYPFCISLEICIASTIAVLTFLGAYELVSVLFAVSFLVIIGLAFTYTYRRNVINLAGLMTILCFFNIVINGLTPDNPQYLSVLELLGDMDVSKVWQANINGVDLNHNYDALFYEYAQIAAQSGYGQPGPRRYPGPFPFSEPETMAVRELVLQEEFPFAIAFHSQGEVIYWSFNGLGFYREARALADASGYALDTATGISSYSGFKDWYLDKFNLPAFTVEIGSGVNPLPFEQFEQIKLDCYPLIAQCAFLVQ